MQTILALVLSKNTIESIKVTQEIDKPVKILKDNKDFFAGYFQMFFNDTITSSKFQSSLKMAY